MTTHDRVCRDLSAWLCGVMVVAVTCLSGCMSTVTDATRRVSVEAHLDSDQAAELAEQFRHRCFLVSPIEEGSYDKDTKKFHLTTHSLGTAAIITTDGYALTAAHVVGDRRGVIVHLQDGEQYRVTLAEVIWKGKGGSWTRDLAVIRLAGDWGSTADAFPWASDQDLHMGMVVALVGRDDAMTGYGESIAAGRICGIQQRVAGKPIPIDRIWYDAPLRKGDSGGPLVNASGELIGINVGVWWYGWRGFRNYALRPDRDQIMSIIEIDRRRRTREKAAPDSPAETAAESTH